MKISNFELTETIGKSLIDRKYHALVDVETGMLWWKKVERLEICKNFTGSWFYIDTGEWVLPLSDVNAMSRAWAARTGAEC